MYIDQNENRENLKQLFEKYNINPNEYSSLLDAIKALHTKMPVTETNVPRDYLYIKLSDGNYAPVPHSRQDGIIIGQSPNTVTAGSIALVQVTGNYTTGWSNSIGISLDVSANNNEIIISPNKYQGGT